jgi:hypothetical protein
VGLALPFDLDAKGPAKVSTGQGDTPESGEGFGIDTTIILGLADALAPLELLANHFETLFV